MRAELNPPELRGFSYVMHLGGGGFADVFLYRQHQLDRRVAVKVLRQSVDDEEASRLFEAEAHLMARVSTHPNIVTIHDADVSPDRRPYLVMEYYPLPHFAERIKRGAMAVHEVLEVGVKMCSAVETAHRADIIHRDIKPANILTSEFGEPGLTDFGISAIHVGQTTDESLGFSPPFAPPEILINQHPGDEKSDVYSLAASLWAMLAGHSPFEHPDRRSSRSEIIARALNEAVPAIPRRDVPRSFELLLRTALDKDPKGRPQSAKSFGMALQAIEQELGYRPTSLFLLQEADDTGPSTPPSEGLAGEKTKIGRGVVVNPQPIPATPVPSTPFASSSTDATEVRGGSFEAPTFRAMRAPELPEEPGTIRVRREEAAPPKRAEAEAESKGESGLPRWAWIATAVTALAAVVFIGLAAIGGGDEDAASSTSVAAEPPSGSPFGTSSPNVEVEPVTNIEGARDGTTVTFTWDTSTVEGVQYKVYRVDQTSPTTTLVATAEIELTDVAADERPCISVLALIPGVTEAPQPAPTACAEA